MKIFSSLLGFLASMKAGMALLSVIAVMSAVGSYFWPESFYQFAVFKLLLLFLLLNMLFCTTNQLVRGLKLRRKGKAKHFNLWRIGVLAIHIGIVLILLGGTVYSFAGQSAHVRIIEGDLLEVAEVIDKAQPYFLKLDSFRIDFNADGSPSQYYSDVTIIEGTKVSGQYCISVNNPLVYRGVKAYQSGYGYLINLQSEGEGGSAEKATLGERDIWQLANSDKALMVYKYIPHYDPALGMNTKSLRPDNPRVIYSVYQNGTLLKADIASFQEKVELEPGLVVTFTGLQPYTVLTLKRDPGLALVAPGGLLLMAGSCLALLLRSKKQGAML
ncbi:MAG: cytochrome c biogenesis protein ResB [Desulfitobacteriia bacterium]|jgi:cytochrome c biogenesis protein